MWGTECRPIFSNQDFEDSANPSDCDDNDDLFPEDRFEHAPENSGKSTAAASVNSGKSTADAIDVPLPSPMWSRKSGRRMTSLGRSRSSTAPLGQCKSEKCDCTAPLGQRLTEKSPTLCRDEVPLDLLCPRSKATLGRLDFSSRSEVPLGHHKKLPRELNREEAKAKVQEMIAIVNRWHDSDDWKPWTPPTLEDEVGWLDDLDAPCPEIIANEMKYRQQLQNVTTAHRRASALSG